MRVSGHDSLKARKQLAVGDLGYDYFSLPEAERTLGQPRRPAVLAQGAAREPAALGGRPDGHGRPSAGHGGLARGRARPNTEIAYRPARVLMQDFTGVPAVVDLAAMRDAMVALGGDPARINPLVAGRSGHRPLGAGRCVRQSPAPSQRNVELEFERNGERYAFLRWGSEGVRQFPRRAAGHRHLPPGQPRISGPGRLDARRATASVGLSRHPGRHRQPHDDDQRPGRPRLGRRRHRGRGGDAGPAGVDADPGGRRLPADRQAAARARPPPTSC